MAYTDPPDFPNNSTVNASVLNQFLRDNLESLRDQNDLNCVVHLSSALASAQSIGNSSRTLVVWQDTVRNLGSMWASTSASKIKMKAVGRYRVWGAARWEALSSADGSRQVNYSLNGSTVAYELDFAEACSGDRPCLNWAVDQHVTSSDQYLQLYVFHTRGSALGLLSGSGNTRLGVRYLGEWVSST